MSTHTPGPWQVDGSHIYTAHPECALLAQVFNPGRKASDYPLVDNARLIAAAPDLLEAAIKTVAENGHLADGDNCTLIHLVRAIAKVTGERNERRR